MLGTFAGACRSRGRREAGGGDLDDDGPRRGEDGDVDGVQDQALTDTRGYSTTRFSNHYSYPTQKFYYSIE